MKKIRDGVASVVYGPLAAGNQICVASYSGDLDSQRLTRLREAVVNNVENVGAFVVSLDGARLLMDAAPFIPSEGDDYESMPDGAIVCRPEQLDVVLAYSQHMAAHGVIRAVFLDHYEAEAFACRHVEIHQGGRRRL